VTNILKYAKAIIAFVISAIGFIVANLPGINSDEHLRTIFEGAATILTALGVWLTKNAPAIEKVAEDIENKNYLEGFGDLESILKEPNAQVVATNEPVVFPDGSTSALVAPVVDPTSVVTFDANGNPINGNPVIV
jgi:hypothetical protein